MRSDCNIQVPKRVRLKIMYAVVVTPNSSPYMMSNIFGLEIPKCHPVQFSYMLIPVGQSMSTFKHLLFHPFKRSRIRIIKMIISNKVLTMDKVAFSIESVNRESLMIILDTLINRINHWQRSV
ncbi:hypothetical protein FGO68_gene743 [Halteria grandinella]|uniref:Uncharacterized protein n=1 Tax=Halteria grandinella TaxID=5974 RepID=A0A8J8T4J5_HALGN|nr:hypothetical protein FGO68_gene743 [Halteria grandinella]